MIRPILLILLLPLMAKGGFFKVSVGDLKVADDSQQAFLDGSFSAMHWRGGYRSRVPIARFPEFAFVADDRVEEEQRGRQNRFTIADLILVIEMDEKKSTKGFVDVYSDEESGWVSVACEIPAEKLSVCEGKELIVAREWFARHQIQVRAKGGLWYRSQIEDEVREGRTWEFDQTFTTMSGGRALAENMALDRELILGESKGKPDVELSSIRGVTVEPIPWAERMPEGEIKVDELSMRVPEDQHFMVVPSLKHLLALMDKVEEDGTPLIDSFSVGGQYRELPTRYREQMGLDLPDVLARMLPVKKVAVTGGDPFFPTGSDVAVILETGKPDFVYSSIKPVIDAKAKAAGATKVEGAGEVAYENKDRSFSSYLIKLEGAVVLSNSAHQIERLKEVASGKEEALGASDEYKFFRHRYPIADDESAYVFISDACLRRWAGPKVRIAASRRSRALAALGQLTSGVVAGEGLSNEYEALLGKVSEEDGGVISEHYGSLGFLTPIGELEIEKVSHLEVEGYRQWRRGYENGWAQFFDPIAIQLKLGEKKEELDMTILPLRVDSDYEDFMSLAGDAVLSQASRKVPRESIFHFAMAVDHDSEMFKEADVTLVEMLPGMKVNPLSWMGESFSLTFEDSLSWQADFDEESLLEMPVLLRVDVESRLKLALFLTALKGSIEGASPDLVSWETRQFDGQKYVAIVGDEDEIGIELTIYYAATKSALLVSLNEDVLKRAMLREREVIKGKKAEGQMFVQTGPLFLQQMGALASSQSWDDRRRGLSWHALPILNEWRKSKGAKDPVAFHQAAFANRISCPGGKGFRWNEKDQTMESVAYGHPARPKYDGKPVEMLKRFKEMSAASSFEDGGMRMQLAMNSETNYERAPLKGAARPADDQVIALKDLMPSQAGLELISEVEEGGFDGEVEKLAGSLKVTSVTEKDGLVVVKEEYEEKGGEEDFGIYKRTYEIGPKGMRMLEAEQGDSSMEADPAGYEYPAELWVGQKFRARSREVWIEDGRRAEFVVESEVTVDGWEAIDGPDGKKVDALKVTRMESMVADGEFFRTRAIEWLARGLGQIRREEIQSNDWGSSKFQVIKVKKQE